MKWRERISILSRKRKQGRNVSVEESPSARISASGSSNTDREDVEKTLSQIRPVIGPDHKSYYILLRGNEDSFTCIQPAKDVITSLDEVVKNVVNSVKQTRPQGTVIPPYLKTSRNSETRSYKNASKKCSSESRKVNGLSSTSNKEIRVTRSVNLDGSYDPKSEEKFLGTENVVENVVLHRTVQTVNCSHNEVTRTSTLVYPLVQNRLDSSGTALGANKQETCAFVPNRKSLHREIPPSIEMTPVRDVSPNVMYTNPIYIKQEPTVHTKQGHTVYVKQEPGTHLKQESEVQMDEHISSSVDETFVPESVSPVEKAKPVTEIRLLAKDGCVLTEDNIAEQVRALIESGTLVIGEDSHIVLTRGNAQEVVLRITPKETEETQMLEQHQLKHEDFDFNEEFLQQHEEEEFESQTNALTLPDSSLQEEICYDPDMAIDSSNNNEDTENSRVQYLLTSISPSPHEMFEECDVKNSDLEKVIQEEEEDASSYCMIDPLLQDADQIEVEKLLLNGDSLLSENEGIVVIQRSDGALVNQDGTPISNELQYFISSTLLDEQTLLPDGCTNQVFLSTKP